jgi:hypothetical protein
VIAEAFKFVRLNLRCLDSGVFSRRKSVLHHQQPDVKTAVDVEACGENNCIINNNINNNYGKPEAALKADLFKR